MRNQSRCTRMWSVTVAGLCVLWFAAPAGAIPLESWDDKIPNANQRFRVLPEFNGEAVLDKETQLVWEKSPLTTSHLWDFTAGFSESALVQCTSRTTGGRKGWRLPSVHELASLVDPTNSNPSLPTGHPFTTVQSFYYWSATTSAGLPTHAWFVTFGSGHVDHGPKDGVSVHVWCVRGGMNAEQY
jgi:hypothetical protein